VSGGYSRGAKAAKPARKYARESRAGRPHRAPGHPTHVPDQDAHPRPSSDQSNAEQHATGILQATRHRQAQRLPRSGNRLVTIVSHFFSKNCTKNGRAEGIRTLTFCMPCAAVSSDGVVLGPVPAGQGGVSVWGVALSPPKSGVVVTI
jgi:hypothetical protein